LQFIVNISLSCTVVSVNSGQVEPMPGISYETAFEVALSIEFIPYHILEHVCIGTEPFHGHLNSGCVGA